MTNLQLFLLSALGTGVGSIIGQRLAKGDLIGRFGWAAVGAMPGAACLIGQPWYMAAMLVAIPVLLIRRRQLAGSVPE